MYCNHFNSLIRRNTFVQSIGRAWERRPNVFRIVLKIIPAGTTSGTGSDIRQLTFLFEPRVILYFADWFRWKLEFELTMKNRYNTFSNPLANKQDYKVPKFAIGNYKGVA